MRYFRQDPSKQDGSAGNENHPKVYIARAAHKTVTKAASIMAALTLIFGMAAPAPTSAWGWWDSSHPTYTQSSIRYCFENTGGWSTTALNTIRAAFEHWDSWMTNRSIYEQGFQCNIHVYITSGGVVGNSIARGVPTVHTGGQILSSDLLINHNYSSQFWIYTRDQDCFVGYCPKRYDLWTVAVHEIGHTLGFGHNLIGNTSYCTEGYWFTSAAAACTNDFYSTDVMYSNAADGYRRWITEDTRRGLVTMGYR